MKPRPEIIASLSIIALTMGGGCGSSSKRPSAATHPATLTTLSARSTQTLMLRPATRPTIIGNAGIALDDIKPVPTRDQPQTVDPSNDEAPVDALVLYAKARDALATNQRFTAVSLLEKAVHIDANSAELYRTLSRAYSLAGNPEKAAKALEQAVAIAPDDLATQVTLGRLYLSRNDARRATAQLRKARLTSGYAAGEPEAVSADYFLARALQSQGYDHAAVECYKSLIKRLARPTLALRSDPQLSDLAVRPDTILSDVARLSEKQGDWEEALNAWRQLSHDEPANFEAASHEVQMHLALGHGDDALIAAANAVRSFGASQQSLDQLRNVGKAIGNDDAMFRELSRLHRDDPRDRAITFALSDLFANAGRLDEAQSALRDGLATSPDDLDLIRKLFEFYMMHGQTNRAGALLIESASKNPGDGTTFTAMLLQMMTPMRGDAIRVSDIVDWETPAGAHGVLDYFLAVAAADGRRDQVRSDAIEHGMKQTPLYPPLFRLAVDRVNAMKNLSPEVKQQAVDKLVAIAVTRGPEGFDDELRGRWFEYLRKPAAALEAYEAAAKVKKPLADTVIAYANMQAATSNFAKAEQIMWRVISEQPSREDTYAAILDWADHENRRLSPASLSVLERWLAADPASIVARLREVVVLFQSNQRPEAKRLADDLLRSHPDNREVLQVAYQISTATGDLEQHIQKAEELYAQSPVNLSLANHLVQIYLQIQRPEDAARIAAAAHRAAAGNPRLLYYVSALYSSARLNKPDLAKDVLREVIDVSPDDSSANNDLGYEWADEGKNLDQAEAMIRKALRSEPDNASYLDSLGWVLYKRGKFDEAKPLLERAAGGEFGQDATVLDHLGDVFYRLGDKTSAGQRWKSSLELAAANERLTLNGEVSENSLKSNLEKKLQEMANGQRVSVAPTLDAVHPTTAQVKQ